MFKVSKKACFPIAVENFPAKFPGGFTCFWNSFWENETIVIVWHGLRYFRHKLKDKLFAGMLCCCLLWRNPWVVQRKASRKFQILVVYVYLVIVLVNFFSVIYIPVFLVLSFPNILEFIFVYIIVISSIVVIVTVIRFAFRRLRFLNPISYKIVHGELYVGTSEPASSTVHASFIAFSNAVMPCVLFERRKRCILFLSLTVYAVLCWR